jgi:hypothetical protein
MSLAREHARPPPRRIPRNKGQRNPADPPRTEEIVVVIRHAGASVRRLFAPHQLRHAHAIELGRGRA